MKCSTCLKVKNIEDFSWKNKIKNIKHTKCKECQNIYSAARYLANKENHKEKVKANRPGLKAKNKEFILDYLKKHPCIDCGISDIRVLQFDHKEIKKDGEKRNYLSGLLTSRIKIVEELEKCDVRCANCHMIRTSAQFGWERI